MTRYIQCTGDSDFQLQELNSDNQIVGLTPVMSFEDILKLAEVVVRGDNRAITGPINMVKLAAALCVAENYYRIHLSLEGGEDAPE